MRKGCMHSYAKFGGAARRHFFCYLRKTDGGHICAPPGRARVNDATLLTKGYFTLILIHVMPVEIVLRRRREI